MRLLPARMSSPFVLAAAIASGCAAVALVVVLFPALLPADGNAFYPAETIRLHTASAVALIAIASWMRRRQEAAAYGLLVGACLLAGWSIEAAWENTRAAPAPMFGLALLAGLVLISAPTAILGIVASTPVRRLHPRIPVAMTLLVLATLVGEAMALTLTLTIREHSDGAVGSDMIWTVGGLLATFANPVSQGMALIAAMLGSLRNEAVAFVRDPSVQGRVATISGPLYVAVGAAIALGLALATAWGLRAQGDAASPAPAPLLVPLLVALVGVVAARWSAYLAWSALVISFGVAASVVLSRAVEAAVAQIPGSQPPWTPTLEWLLQVGAGFGVAMFAMMAAVAGVRAARDGMPSRHPRVTAPAVVLVPVALAAIAWTWSLQFAGRLGADHPFLEGVFWLAWSTLEITVIVVLIGAVEAARSRLVPAVAEAEAVARRPLRPFRYLETVVVEALTGRAHLRRAAMDAERARLASDLHADVLPSLAEIKAQAEAGAAREDVALRLRRLEDEIRDLVAERRLVVLEEFGLVEAIEWLLGRAEERMSLEVALTVDDASTSQRPPREVERAAFRIAQLAVENAIQHASPTRLGLVVLVRSNQVRVSVSDDGRGLAAAPDDRTRDHLGIADMRGRAADVRGDVQVLTPPAGGTTVTFAWPSAS